MDLLFFNKQELKDIYSRARFIDQLSFIYAITCNYTHSNKGSDINGKGAETKYILYLKVQFFP